MSEETLRDTLSRVVNTEVTEVAAAPAGEVKPVGEEKPAGEVKPTGELPKGIRPPESWKPAIREQHWAKLPLPVQTEIFRREREINDALQHTAEARKGMEQFGQLVNEYKDVFEFEKAPPMQSVRNLLNIHRTLRSAPAPQRAQFMAQIINGFGVDVKLLDQALSMLVSPQDPAAQQVRTQAQNFEQVLDQKLAPMRDFMTNLTRQQQTVRQTAEQELQTEIQKFAEDPANEYFEVVRDVMADIMEAGASRGQKISLQDAYKRAILANNDLAGQFSQERLRQEAAKLSAPAAEAARKAGLSVTGSQTLGAPPESGINLRSDIEAAVARHSGR